MANTANETWRPDERPDLPPTQPYDPFKPEEQRGPQPLPPAVQPQPEVPEPAPVGDPPTDKAQRL